MRNWEDILMDIKSYAWNGEREKCLKLTKEYTAAYKEKFKTVSPNEKEKTKLRRITLRLFENAIIFEMHPDIKQL